MPGLEINSFFRVVEIFLCSSLRASARPCSSFLRSQTLRSTYVARIARSVKAPNCRLVLQIQIWSRIERVLEKDKGFRFIWSDSFRKRCVNSPAKGMKAEDSE